MDFLREFLLATDWALEEPPSFEALNESVTLKSKCLIVNGLSVWPDPLGDLPARPSLENRCLISAEETPESLDQFGMLVRLPTSFQSVQNAFAELPS